MRRLLRLTLLALALAAPLPAEQWGFWDYGPGAFGDQAWKEPVANAAALPASGNEIGDVRVTLDDLAAHVWDGDSWEAWAGGGGSGTVTSVALAVPAEWTVSGSPVTGAGTITIAEATQTANTVYAGPTTGSAAAPGFRALVSADIPNNAADTSGNAATATSASSALDLSCTNCIGGTEIDESSLGTVPTATDATNATNATTATTATTANAGDSATAFFSSGTIEAARLPAVTTLASACTDAQVLGGNAGATGVECQADDDVPESGDFGAAADLEADGSLSADVVAPAEMADADHGDVSWSGGVATVDTGAVGLTELADDGGCTGGQATRRNAGDTAFECYTPAAGGIGGTLSATDLAIAINSGTGGATLQSSAATLSASGKLTLPEAPYLTGVISPASVSTQQNDWAPTGGDTASVWRIQSSATVLVTGISGGVAGRVLTLINIGANTFYLYPNHGSSSAANQFDIKVGGYSGVAVLPGDSALTLWYDGTSSRWRAMTPTEGEVILGGTSGNFTRLSGTNTAGRAILDSPAGAAGGLITNTIYLGNSTSVDTGLEKSAAGVAKVTNGSTETRGLLGGGAAVASATALPVPTGRVFHVTGTTTVTSITSTNFGSGACVTLIFDGALTFTDGSNLKLAGDFVTTADDTISLCYDGTNWFETGRSVN